MGNQVNIGPYTNFEEIYTYLRCPAKLYLQLAGYRSEIERKYTPPSVSPAKLGIEGEKLIEQAFKGRFDVNVLSVPDEDISLPKGKLEKALKKVRKIIVNKIRIQLSLLRDVEVRYTPIVLSEQAEKLKKDFEVRAIISKVDFTTVPHHRIGEIDFIGLKENNEVVIIEVKNKQAKLNEKDRLQLEYYIDGLPKQYHYTKFYPHMYEVMSQLYPRRYRNHIKLAKGIDLLKEAIDYSRDIVTDTVMGLKSAERKKFISTYPGTGNNESEPGAIDLLMIFDRDYMQVSKSSEKFLTTIPEYFKLIETYNTYKRKLSSLIKEFESAGNLMVEFMEKDVKNGLLVDIRRSEVIEVERSLNFDKIVKGVWQIKKSAFFGKGIAPKRTDLCSHCSYRKACKEVLKDEEPEECKSITSIVHNGFKNLNLEVRKPSFEPPIFDNHGILRVRYIEPKVVTELSDEDLLAQVLNETEWEYVPDFAKKRGWKQLYAEAVASNKLSKEFSFWRL